MLDVGSKRFIAAASTLTLNSAYFAALLSDDWINPNEPGSKIFLDQDPMAFSVLLSFIQRGIIKVAVIDTDVLALADFLDMESHDDSNRPWRLRSAM